MHFSLFVGCQPPAHASYCWREVKLCYRCTGRKTDASALVPCSRCVWSQLDVKTKTTSLSASTVSRACSHQLDIAVSHVLQRGFISKIQPSAQSEISFDITHPADSVLHQQSWGCRVWVEKRSIKSNWVVREKILRYTIGIEMYSNWYLLVRTNFGQTMTHIGSVFSGSWGVHARHTSATLNDSIQAVPRLQLMLKNRKNLVNNYVHDIEYELMNNAKFVLITPPSPVEGFRYPSIKKLSQPKTFSARVLGN